MSLTKDMIRLKEVTDKIAAKRVQRIMAPESIAEKIEGSYYERRTEHSNCPTVVLQKYDINTPLELKIILEKMWHEMEKEDMDGVIPVSMVSAAKNRPQHVNQGVEQIISPFIYEF